MYRRDRTVHLLAGLAGGLVASFAMERFSARWVPSHPMSVARLEVAGSLVHYTFGGSVGLLYGALTAARPGLAAGYGMPFGIAVWIVADEIGMPMSGLAKPPSAYPLKDHASGLSAHLVYGAVAEAVRRKIVRTWYGHGPW